MKTDYIKYSDKKVYKSKQIKDSEGILIVADYSESGEILGIEIINFNIKENE